MDLTERTGGQWWQTDEPFVTVTLPSLRRLGIAAYEKAGASPEDAAFLLGMNVDKALQGDHARGVDRLPDLVNAALNGHQDLRAEIKVLKERPGFALVDGGPKASGRLVCKRAMEIAVAKARQTGIAFTGAQAQGQLLTPLAQIAVDAGMIGIVFNQSFPTVAPFGGAGPLLGNQPLAIAVPAGRHDPILLDMAMTQTSAAGMFLAAKQKQTVAPGLLLDEDGEPTTDATDFPTEQTWPGLGPGARGSLTPLGNNHKGYAMIFMLSLLSAVLTDTSPPWELFYHLKKRGRYGTVHIAIDPASLMPLDQFKARVDEYIDTVKVAPKAKGTREILYPGEKSQRLRRQREQAGILALPASHAGALDAMATGLGLQKLERVAS
jgi:LDH2 family malate/lactate/ureidoglycolate dehydrogenase